MIFWTSYPFRYKLSKCLRCLLIHIYFLNLQTLRLLERVYKDPRDIDLLVGGLSEVPENGAMLGPTFSCIVSDQFMRLRYGDRYFYLNQNQPAPFSRLQLEQIKKVTLARIFCDNADDVLNIQPDVFKVISEG